MTLIDRAPARPEEPGAPGPVLRVEDLRVRFRTSAGTVTAVDGVSFALEAGRTLAVVGESGSGKSTTAAAINGLIASNGRVDGGRILFDGRDLVGLGEREFLAIRGRGIGLVPQDPMSNLNPIQRVGRQISEALEVHGLARGSAARRRVVELLEMVGIPEPARRARQYPHELSGGMRQRVLIAMGLACRPRLLIADEPTSALDVTVQRNILDRLGELTAELGTAVVLITHDLALATERADDVVVMFRGEMVEHGPAAEILRNPTHEYTRRLLTAAPTLATRTLVTPVGAADAEAPPVVVVEKATRVYRGAGRSGFTAVDEVGFEIPRGETVSIVGESGSGKSTTARMVLGLERPTSGRVLVDDHDIATMGKRELFAFRRRVQPVFQNPYGSLDARFTVGESIAEPLEIHRVGPVLDRRARVAELLEQVALPQELATRLPHELSGGQRQRVAIARALALRPEVVVLDEAVSALDVIVQAQVLELLARLQRELGLSYLFISHDLAVVRMVSHRIHVMQRGRIVESGTPDEIFEHPREEYTRELIAAIPGEGR